MEVKPHAEHEEDDAHLGELLGHLVVGDESRRIWSHGDAGQEITDDWGKPQAVRHIAEDERRDQAACQSQDEVEVVVHGISFTESHARYRILRSIVYRFLCQI